MMGFIRTMDDNLLGAREKLLVAKADRSGGRWLPLYLHLTDTAGVMEKLLSTYMSSSFCDMCGLSWEILEQTALFLAFSHDIGKATAVFQRKILNAVPFCEERLLKYGVRIPFFLDKDEMRNTPHNLTGENILLSYGCPKEIAVVAGAHHGVPTTNKDGTTDKETFMQQKELYDQLEAKLDDRISKQTAVVKGLEQKLDSMPEGLAADSERISVDRLTKDVVETFVEKVIVKPGQQVEIRWKFQK